MSSLNIDYDSPISQLTLNNDGILPLRLTLRLALHLALRLVLAARSCVSTLRLALRLAFASRTCVSALRLAFASWCG